MRELHGKVVALTGAGSGLGRALAIRLGEEGAALALCDIDEVGLKETARRAAGSPRVSTHVVDVSDRAAVEAYALAAERQHGVIDVLINNAGVGAVATVEDVSYEDLEWVIGVDLWGVIHGVKAFLPLLKKRPEAHIVNISSVNGFLPFPTNGPYNISKYGVTALSETLMEELCETNVAVTCVHPGGIKTNISRNSRHTTDEDHARFERITLTTPDRAARAVIRGIKRGERRLYVGVDAKLMALGRWLFPMTMLEVVAKVWLRMARDRKTR